MRKLYCQFCGALYEPKRRNIRVCGKKCSKDLSDLLAKKYDVSGHLIKWGSRCEK